MSKYHIQIYTEYFALLKKLVQSRWINKSMVEKQAPNGD